MVFLIDTEFKDIVISGGCTRTCYPDIAKFPFEQASYRCLQLIVRTGIRTTSCSSMQIYGSICGAGRLSVLVAAVIVVIAVMVVIAVVVVVVVCV